MFNLFEDPTLIVVAGAILEGLFLITLVRTGRGAILGAIGVVAAIVAAGWALEWFVVTDREAVQVALEGTADALESNGLSAVLAHTANDAHEIRARLSTVLPNVTIETAKMRDVDIQVQANTVPKTARATLLGIIHGRDKTGQVPYETVLRRFAVRLRQEGDRWVITDYEELPMDLPGGQSTGE